MGVRLRVEAAEGCSVRARDVQIPLNTSHLYGCSLSSRALSRKHA